MQVALTTRNGCIYSVISVSVAAVDAQEVFAVQYGSGKSTVVDEPPGSLFCCFRV